jgi:protein TonB
MRTTVRPQQSIAPRERDINSASFMWGAMLFSATLHLLFAGLIIAFSYLGAEEKSVTVGYKVNLVGRSPGVARKTPAAPVKSAPAPPKQVTPPPTPTQPSMVKSPAGKKIVPVKENAPKVKEVAEPVKVETPTKAKAPEKPAPPLTQPTARPRPGPGGDGGGGYGASSLVAGEEVAYAYYINMISTKVDENWNTIGVDVITKRTDPVVRFEVTRSGAVANVRMERSSGSPALDQSALEAVSGLALPPLPGEYPADVMRIRFTFNYEQSLR